MKLAAIDIGSNAVRLQVTSVLFVAGQVRFKRVEYIRFPLRLGKDVFQKQYITKDNEDQLLKLLTAFKLLIDLYDVDTHMVCATAAFRDAGNRHDVVQRIHQTLGISIQILQGEEEALLLHEAIKHVLEPRHSYLHVEVGGGSTEISFYTGAQKVAARSFNLGTIRLLTSHDHVAVWDTMRTWVTHHAQQVIASPVGIATGGNIRKLAQMSKWNTKKTFSLKKLEAIKSYIATYSLVERINHLALNPDRADVILPAIEIYSAVLRCGGVQKIWIPDVSLRDGMIRKLYEQVCRGSASAEDPGH